jgi:hypothetical protein
MAPFDLNGAANAAAAQQNALAGTWFGAGGRQDRSLQYISPDMSGFKLQVGFQPKGNVVGAEGNASIGLTYAAGPFAVAYAGEQKRTTTGDNSNAVAASFDLGVVKLMAGYADSGKDMKGTTVGAVAPVAGFNIGFNYTRNSDSSAGASEFFVNKEIFKGTYAYFDYGNLDKSNAAYTKGDAFALGVIFTF